MTYLKNIFLPAICLALISIQTANADRVLKYPRVRQEKSNWCWAACSQWILGFHGIYKTQTEIAEYGFTDGVARDQWNWIYTETDKGDQISSNGANPGNFDFSDFDFSNFDFSNFDPGNFQPPQNNQTGGDVYGRGINIILEHFGVPWKVEGEIPGVQKTNPANYTLTEQEFKNEIEDGHPFVVRWAWSSGGGHFVVATGYTTAGSEKLCWIMNPLEDDGMQIYNYKWVMNNQNGPQTNLTHVWDYTLQTDRTDTVPELTTQFPSNPKPGEKVSLKLVSVLNGRDVSKSTYFKSLTEGVAIDSATRTISWTQTANGPNAVRFIRESGNAIDTITKSFGGAAIAGYNKSHAFSTALRAKGGKHVVTLNVPAAASPVTRFWLYSANGAVVHTQRFEGAGSHTCSFGRNEFSPGVYLIKAANGNQILTEKLTF